MTTPACAICNASNAKFCSACRSISYCSTKCQKADWPLHKTTCKKFSTLPARPSPSHKLAVLFPVDSKDPLPIWVNCYRHDWGVGPVWDNPDVIPLLKAEGLDSTEPPRVEYVYPPRPDLSHTVQIICREEFTYDGSTLNLCVQQTTKGRRTYGWKGPLVVLRIPNRNTESPIYEDSKAADIRVAVDFFLSYRGGVIESPTLRR